uniref:Uncharacterized protein n=1 Tax=Romanomermis culicivorax TaxID=13658 RepID=A0A915KWD2_ROMCU
MAQAKAPDEVSAVHLSIFPKNMQVAYYIAVTPVRVTRLNYKTRKQVLSYFCNVLEKFTDGTESR